MTKYEVLLYPKAYRDIEEIYSYLAIEKLEPGIAKGQTDRIWDAISSLGSYPESHQDRLTGRYAGKGYKQLIIDNYIAIYKIDKKTKKVFVVTVQYGGRNL
ncbi:MAG: type II toxin-antitoxin system RelE/ParE family toxin [Clostridiales bacterium]|nr:type II toxin-antitoxin system RelE/ParE family toxin [Clostridiales bacterium]